MLLLNMKICPFCIWAYTKYMLPFQINTYIDENISISTIGSATGQVTTWYFMHADNMMLILNMTNLKYILCVRYDTLHLQTDLVRLSLNFHMISCAQMYIQAMHFKYKMNIVYMYIFSSIQYNSQVKCNQFWRKVKQKDKQFRIKSGKLKKPCSLLF